MAYNEYLADRIIQILDSKYVSFEEKKMMGGLCFMIEEKMCMGISGEQLMARVDPEIYEACIQKKGCHEMKFTGRPMKGFVFIDAEVIDRPEELTYWVDICLEFNPKAKKSKKRKK